MANSKFWYEKNNFGSTVCPLSSGNRVKHCIFDPFTAFKISYEIWTVWPRKNGQFNGWPSLVRSPTFQRLVFGPQSHKWIFIWWKDGLMRARYGQTTDRNPLDRKSSDHTKDGHPLHLRAWLYYYYYYWFSVTQTSLCTMLGWYN